MICILCISVYILSMIYSQYEYVSCLFTLGVSQISGFSKLVKSEVS